ncbi:hypothetical protein BGZ49_002121 [Haplosporangium sp. Z 27]|nr:hypothetical protein BGZ49_002121 [Haplosporangium sp. Z 27]
MPRSSSSVPPSNPPAPSSYPNPRSPNPGSTFSTSFRPVSSQFLTSQSSKVQDYIGPSPSSTIGTTTSPPTSSSTAQGNSGRQPIVHSKVTTINASGSIDQQYPVDLSQLEVNDYFTHPEDDTTTRSSTLKSSEYSRKDDSSELDRGRARVQIGAPKTDDLQGPPRYVIGQPSLSALSGTSRTTSPSPSLASSILSDKSSLRSSQIQQQLQRPRQIYRHTLDVPQLQRPRHASDAPLVEPNPIKGAALQRSASVSSRPSPTSTPSPSRLPKKAVASKPPPATGQDTHNPNLRSRLTRFFRSNPKSEHSHSVDRDQQRTLKQANVPRPVSRQQTHSQGEAQRRVQPQPQQSQSPKLQQQQQQSSPANTLQKSALAPPTRALPAKPETFSNVQSDEERGNNSVKDITSPEGKKDQISSSSTIESALATPRAQQSDNSTSSNPQSSFAAGVTPFPFPPPPIPRTIEDNRARQRRVSSISSSHSIRQVGAYGGDYVNPAKMISPSRRANPYYSGVVARFANTGKHSMHDRDLSRSSSGRKSMVSVGGERTKVGAEAASSREKLNLSEQSKSTQVSERPQSSSTVSSVVYDAKGKENFLPKLELDIDNRDHDGLQQSSLATVLTAAPIMYTAIYTEEYGVEKDESVRNVPISDAAKISAPKDRSRFSTYPRSPAASRNFVLQPDAAMQQKQMDFSDMRDGTMSASTTWSKTTGAHTMAGTISDNISTTTQTETDARLSFDSQDSDGDVTPSVSTLSSAQVLQDYREQGLIMTEGNWNESVPNRNLSLPTVMVQRPSMEVSILPDQPPFQGAPPLSPTTSVQSTSSNKIFQQHMPKRVTSMGDWSESSYDPCAPSRWDELFEMDPTSKGPLWLSHRGLGQIPHDFFDGLRNLRELYLDHNDIKVVPDSLLKLTKLDVLDLSSNSISSFHSAFKMKKLKNLRRLNLDHNMLTDISPIYKLKALRELRLNYNFVPYLAISIQHMTKLKILAMESNQLTTLPESMGRLGNLCELRLSDNNIRTLPPSIGSIRTLQVLALRSNLLESLPESWKDMENLSTLDLACNRLTSLPSDIVRLPKLTHLDLHDNHINALPDKIGQLSNLVVLQLCNNQLRELPKDIGRLRDLQDLVLSFNQLQYLPDEIGKLSKLQEIKFDNNPLQSLPKAIQRLTNVRRIHLQGCELRDLPVEFGIAFRDLTYLDLSGNHFEVLPALDQMTKLEEFYISNNHLREIGTSSLKLQGTIHNHSTSTVSAGSGFGGQAQSGARTMSLGGQASSSGGVQNGSSAGGPNGAQGTGSSGFVTSGGVTASKLSELRHLRVFEAHDNQIRVLSANIKLLPKLEVLDLGNNLLTWLPKEVGDLPQLKVLILEGNPVKSLPSSLSKLMGTLDVFRIGEWPENGFEITRDQAPVSMKINVLQSFMPRQIERTLLMRMHDSILKRVQELDSQQYRDQHESEKSVGSGAASRSFTTTSSSKFSSSTHALVSNSTSTLQDNTSRYHRGITQGLTIATQNLMVNRSFALPPASTDIASSESDPAATLNCEGINLSYTEYTPSNIRALPTLQLSNFKGHSAPITAMSMSVSPQPASSGPLSSFPLLNSLRPRKSQQQLTTKNGSGSGSRPRTMYAASGQQQQDIQILEQQTLTPRLTHRMSRVFDFGSNKQKNDGDLTRTETLESSTLNLSTDAMVALGLGGQSGSTGSAIRSGSGDVRPGDGSLTNVKSSIAIKSSPTLTSMPFPLFSTLPSTSASTDNQSSARSPKPILEQSTSTNPDHASKSLRRSSSNIEAQDSGMSMTSLPWLRLRSSTSPFNSSNGAFEQQNDYPAASASVTSTTTSMSTSSLFQQPMVNGQPISAPTPPPILLNYNLDSSLLDIPAHLYYSAGGDDVDGDHPDEGESRPSQSFMDVETEDDDRSTTTGGDSYFSRNHGNLRMSEAVQSSPEPHNYLSQQTHYHLSANDPVLKIAVLKGIYDQILQNVDQLVEHNVQESPAKKNSRFKLLNTLRFLKADRNGGGSSSSGSYQQHHSSLSSSFIGQHPMTTTMQ